jgi:hypothetical protein
VALEQCRRNGALATLPRLGHNAAKSDYFWRFRAGSALAEVNLSPCRLSVGHLEALMLWYLVIALLVLWALGLATSYTLGGMLHLMLLVALVIAVVQLEQGRRTV